MMRTATLKIRTFAALIWLAGFPMLAHAGAVKRHWRELDGLNVRNATVITKNGQSYRGRLAVTPTGAMVIHHGTYQRWVTVPNSPAIPKESVARIVVRHRYKLTTDEEKDLWWYVGTNWKAIFYPQLSNLFPIATVFHAGMTGVAVLSTPIAVLAELLHPPATDTIEILPDAAP